MLIIQNTNKQHLDQLLRTYKRKLDTTKKTSRVKEKMTFTKPSKRRRVARTKAIYTQQYRVKNGLV